MVKKWVRAEIVILRQCAGTMTVMNIGKLTGRTGSAVRAKARELGISLRLRGNYHQSVKDLQCDVEMARVLHDKGVSRHEIADRLRMPVKTVNSYIYFDRRV
ncbi:TPA: DNA-binding protein [Salmonella enterica subsp. enterica serovar Welikade]|nr:DNA-binding protein [Salmonella enterica subsp. enterica serovar Welikade]